LSAETLPDLFDAANDSTAPVVFARIDDPEHHRLRRMMTSQFTFRRTEAMRPQIQELVDKYLDAMIDKGPPADIVRDFGLPVPSMVIALLLGVPPDDLQLFQHNTAAGLDVNSTDEERARGFIEMYAYIQELVARKERDPGDDLISRLITDYVATGHGGNAGLLALLDQLPIPVKTEKVEEGLGPPGEGEEEMSKSERAVRTINNRIACVARGAALLMSEANERYDRKSRGGGAGAAGESGAAPSARRRAREGGRRRSRARRVRRDPDARRR